MTLNSQKSGSSPQRYTQGFISKKREGIGGQLREQLREVCHCVHTWTPIPLCWSGVRRGRHVQRTLAKPIHTQIPTHKRRERNWTLDQPAGCDPRTRSAFP